MKRLLSVTFILLIILNLTFSEPLSNQNRTFKLKKESREVLSFLRTTHVFKTITNLLLGSDVEVKATRNEILAIISKIINIGKMYLERFDQRSSNYHQVMNEAAIAGLIMAQGYVKFILSDNETCAQKHLCEASQEAAHIGGDIGNIVAQLGSWASSYMLDYHDFIPFNKSYDAMRRGRVNDNCAQIFSECDEKQDQYSWQIFN